MAKVYATPGVYIEEKSAFPNSAVPVATAVPAFIGYTEKAIRNKRDLTNVPTRISSFGEFLLYFGGAPKTTYDITTKKLNYKLEPNARRFMLFNSMRLFFANGGNDCYIVSVGDYDSAVAAGDFHGEEIVDGEKVLIGINTLLKEPEPTMVVIPDAVLLEEADCYSLQQLMIQHCGLTMRSRVAILDVHGGYKKRSRDSEDVIEKFRMGVGNNFLDFASAYYPWLDTTIVSAEEVDFLNVDTTTRTAFMNLLKKDNAQSVKEGVLDQGRANLINAEIDHIPTAALHAELFKVFEGLGKLAKDIKNLEQKDIEDAAAALDNVPADAEDIPAEIDSALSTTNFGKLLANIPTNTMAAIAALEAFDPEATLPDPALDAKEGAVEALTTASEALQEIVDQMDDGDLIGTRNQFKAMAANLGAAAKSIEKLKGKADGDGNIQEPTAEDIQAEFMKMVGAKEANLAEMRAAIVKTKDAFAKDSTLTEIKEAVAVMDFPKDAADGAKTAIAAMNADLLIVKAESEIEEAIQARKDVKTLHQTLLAISPLYREVMNTLRAKLNLLPPSGCMAGVYSMVDSSIGVWQSPANVSVGSVIKPAVNLTNEEQEDLNVPLSGKAVNAIRTFPGKGVLVWGARTLDGNSQDWRYISVRRTVIFIEQSIKYAAEPYVFDPNTANTWVNIKATISNFLTNVWQQGALAGATAEDAFSVDVGLGVTMTPVDILDGIMRITVKLAVTRPAEFIVITFQQQMQKS